LLLDERNAFKDGTFKGLRIDSVPALAVLERKARNKRLRALRARERERGERKQVTSPSSERAREADLTEAVAFWA